jgi:hypothetical protein
MKSHAEFYVNGFQLNFERLGILCCLCVEQNIYVLIRGSDVQKILSAFAKCFTLLQAEFPLLELVVRHASPNSLVTNVIHYPLSLKHVEFGLPSPLLEAKVIEAADDFTSFPWKFVSHGIKKVDGWVPGTSFHDS